MPSSAWWMCRARLACRRAASRASACRSTRRQPRTIRSTCAAVPARPTAVRVRSPVSPRASGLEPWRRQCRGQGVAQQGQRGRDGRISTRSGPRRVEAHPPGEPPAQNGAWFHRPGVELTDQGEQAGGGASRCADSSAIRRRVDRAPRRRMRRDEHSGRVDRMASPPSSAEATIHPVSIAGSVRDERSRHEEWFLFQGRSTPTGVPGRATGPALAKGWRYAADSPGRCCQVEKREEIRSTTSEPTSSLRLIFLIEPHGSSEMLQ